MGVGGRTAIDDHAFFFRPACRLPIMGRMEREALVELIHRVLDDQGVDADEALAVLLGAMVERHVDVELRRLGRREPYPIHNERADALKAVGDAVHQAQCRAEKQGEDEPDPMRAVWALLMEAQFAAEREAGIGGEDEDEPPRMRIVRD